MRWITGFFALVAFASVCAGEYTITSDTIDEHGIRKLLLDSPYQPGPLLIRIAAPVDAVALEHKSFLFVLPVEAGEGTKYGDGLQEVLKTGLHTRNNLIVVAPSFAQLPWYADHPADLHARQESYLLKAVLPAVAQLYPSKEVRRLLLGFSKSGWGAYSLILRHPELFAAAAAWDAPLMKDKPDQFGMDGIFATQENFERYHVAALLKAQAASFQDSKRLYLGGYGNFRKPTQDAHALMDSLQIQHEYADGPKRAHIWGSGWIDAAVIFLSSAAK